MFGLGSNVVSRKGVQEHLFSRVSTSQAPEYSTFNTPYEWHGTIDSGYLIPFLCVETVPGDIFKLKTRHLVRLASPMLVPVMQNLYVNYELYHVKNRYIFDKWKNLMGEQRNPRDSVDYQVPMLNTGSQGVERRSIFDCFGIRANIPNYEFSALPLRAYNLIYNEWYRDENLQDWVNVGGTGTTENPVDEFGETDQLSNYTLKKRNKSHDYFTSMLPFQQKGDPTIIGLDGFAPVVGNGTTIGLEDTNGVVQGLRQRSTTDYRYLTGDPTLAGEPVGTYGNSSSEFTQYNGLGLATDPAYSGMHADISQVLGINIADFQTAMQIQAIKVRDALGGTRYPERIWNTFRVKIADAELHRPELLAQFKQAFYTTPIAQTSGTTETEGETPQGNLSAVSHAYVDRGYDFVKAFDDFGYVIGLLSITTDNNYQQGLHKKWSRKQRFDFYDPLLQNIAEQPVKMKELIVQSDDVVDEDGNPVNEKTLGYQEMNAEYKYGERIITGDFVSNPDNPSQSLDRWHLAPYYDPETTKLNSDFIEYNIPLERTLAITGTEENPQPQFLVDSYIDIKKTSPMALYNIPAYLGMRF